MDSFSYPHARLHAYMQICMRACVEGAYLRMYIDICQVENVEVILKIFSNGFTNYHQEHDWHHGTAWHGMMSTLFLEELFRDDDNGTTCVQESLRFTETFAARFVV
jgi:hypothetical protein